MWSCRRLAACCGVLLGIAFGSRPAAADVLPFAVEDGTFLEYIGPYAHAPVEEGLDPALAEAVSLERIFDFGPGLTMFFSGAATARELGPLAQADANSYSVFSDPDSEYGAFDWAAVTEIRYQVAVYNLVDLGAPAVVPLVGHARARARIYAEDNAANAAAFMRMSLAPTGSPFVQQLTAACYPQTPTCGAFDDDDYWLTLDVPVGAAQYAHAAVDVFAYARVRLDTGASSTGGEITATGNMNGLAWIDPVFEVDPSWPDADKIGVVVSANVEPALAPEPAGAPLALLALLLLARARPAQRPAGSSR